MCEGYNALSVCRVPQSYSLHVLQLLHLSLQVCVELFQIRLKGISGHFNSHSTKKFRCPTHYPIFDFSYFK